MGGAHSRWFAAEMHITRLRVINFRNHRRTEIEPGQGLTVLVGANAQGKSSLLEAVEVAATGRSHRAQRDGDLITLGESWARVHAAAARADRDVEIDVALRADASAPQPGRLWREVRLNGVPVRRGEIFGHLLCVVATPHDADIAAGGPAPRRRLVDLLLAQMSPSYFYAAQRYARAVLQRNQLLRAGRAAPGVLEPWDEQVAVLGAAITVRRRALVDRMAAAAREIYGEVTAGREALTVTYAPNLAGADEEELAQDARRALAQRRPAELARGVTLAGPHRDDVHLAVDGRSLRLYGSRGQQLAAVLALRLAERRLLREDTGEEPTLLLDDVVMAMDEPRQAQLLTFARGAQTLVTVTTLATLPELPADAAVYRVAGGTVEAQRAHLP